MSNRYNQDKDTVEKYESALAEIATLYETIIAEHNGMQLNNIRSKMLWDESVECFSHNNLDSEIEAKSMRLFAEQNIKMGCLMKEYDEYTGLYKTSLKSYSDKAAAIIKKLNEMSEVWDTPEVRNSEYYSKANEALLRFNHLVDYSN